MMKKYLVALDEEQTREFELWLETDKGKKIRKKIKKEFKEGVIIGIILGTIIGIILLGSILGL